jgi:hypothetical protein
MTTTTKEENFMKKQIRRGVFETNSSSTHSLTMMMKDDYKRWENENLYLFNGYTYGWDFNKPVNNALYTREEAIEFVKNSRYYDTSSNDEIDDVYLREFDFISFDDEGSEYLEGFYEEFTTPSGETIVAFGEYGYDG